MLEIASIFEAHFSRCSITIYNFYPRVFFSVSFFKKGKILGIKNDKFILSSRIRRPPSCLPRRPAAVRLRRGGAPLQAGVGGFEGNRGQVISLFVLIKYYFTEKFPRYFVTKGGGEEGTGAGSDLTWRRISKEDLQVCNNQDIKETDDIFPDYFAGRNVGSGLPPHLLLPLRAHGHDQGSHVRQPSPIFWGNTQCTILEQILLLDYLLVYFFSVCRQHLQGDGRAAGVFYELWE